jgi:hypothetical protein
MKRQKALSRPNQTQQTSTHTFPLQGTSREEQQTKSTGYIIHGMLKVQYYDIVHIIVILCVRVE